MPSSSSEPLTLAFRLAFFIHGDRAAAVRVAAESYAKLEVAAAAQDKRLYYTPVGRSDSYASSHGQRTKVAMGELHLLQRLVYIESDSVERAQERSAQFAALNEEDMVVRFIKHLIRITTRRNSFYVTLGLSRLLFNYSTSETSGIYNAIMQDCDRMKDDYYYRSRKRKLIQELQERFGDFVRLQKGRHGEERFEACEEGTLWGGLVDRCLAHFTPWKTTCVIPEDWDPLLEELAALSFQGEDPDNEHPVEIRRMHSIVHPECYRRLVSALGYDEPKTRLTIPRFFMPNGKSGSPNDRGHGSALTDDELSLIQSELSERASRRRSFSAGLLRIMVDGVERQRLDPRRQSSVRFEIEDNAELVEVVGRRAGIDILLATHVLSMYQNPPDSSSIATSVILEGGQRVSFEVGPAIEGGHGASLQVAYGETGKVKQLLLNCRRALWRISDPTNSSPRMLAPALAFSLMVLIGAALVASIVMVRRQAGRLGGSKVAQVQPATTSTPAKEDFKSSHSPSNNGAKPQSGGTEIPGATASKVESNKRAGRRFSAASGLNDQTRSVRSHRYAAISLLRVKTVYVDPLGEGSFADTVRELLSSRIAEDGRLTVAAVRNDAQAVFKGKAEAEDKSNGTGKISLQLVGPDGATLWSIETTGTPAEVTASACRRLDEEIERLRRIEPR